MRYIYLIIPILFSSCTSDSPYLSEEDTTINKIVTSSINESQLTINNTEITESIIGNYYELSWDLENGDTTYFFCEDAKRYWSLGYSENASDTYQSVAENHSEGQLVNEKFGLYDYYFTYVNEIVLIEGGFIINESISLMSENTKETWLYLKNNILTNGKSFYVREDHISDFENRDCGLLDDEYGGEETAQ